MKKLVFAIIAAVLCLTLAGCAKRTGTNTTVSTPAPAETESNPSWAIYWYLCGSDLESWHGCATADIEEMLEVELPEDVQMIIQTGGALKWSREDIRGDVIGRWIYDCNGLRLLEEQSLSNMGDKETLTFFLKFCTDNYPAERTMVLFWNHGGGSVSGAEFDANYYYDSLTLDEFRTAFSEVFTPDANTPPIDLIGFDACLMATIDTASTFRDISRYMVASEELEPGNGWYYSGWLKALASDPKMDGATLGRAICDAYVQGCQLADTDDDITLSLTDLSKIGPLLDAYNDMGTEALSHTVENPEFYVDFSRGAITAESYGGNTQEQGYSNMVDLGHLARNNIHLLPGTSEKLLAALDDCIIYRINGPYRSESSGLSCYYSYSGDMDNFVSYTDVGCSEAFKYLYGYGLSGKVSQAGVEYMKSRDINVVPSSTPKTFDISALEGAAISVDDMGLAELYVGEKAAKTIVSAQSILVLYDGDRMLNLGWSDTSSEDFEQGLFSDYIDGYWPSIDGHLVHTEVVWQGSDYTVYSVPVLLNDEQCNLRVVYDEHLQDYTVLGARKGLSDDGMADKNLTKLKIGDRLTFVYQDRAVDGSGGFGYTAGETIVITADTMFYEAPLPPGEYGIMFKLFDAKNHSAFSEVLLFSLDEYYIYFY